MANCRNCGKEGTEHCVMCQRDLAWNKLWDYLMTNTDYAPQNPLAMAEFIIAKLDAARQVV